ncbi:glycosyltransferase family 2 protein [Geobacter sp. OR-1]|uniref:glycosyltransferase family 2 protein n=1 Tax=Geobacter sp. OR-1 TaxID=1266765 RepID=UPI001364C028|nr:glycosyltransferase family 2 protein [Geobacter sp. OR-1]
MTAQRPKTLQEIPSSEKRVGDGGLRKQGYYKASVPDKPLVTVITAVRNRAYCIEECINSVLAQSYDNVEYIVVDGASSDGTVDILRKYDDKIDCWVSEPDEGIYHALNKAVAIAGGDWLYFIGSDDLMLDCLAFIVPVLSSEESIYYGDVFYMGSKRAYNGPFNRYEFFAKGINHQGVFFPRSVFSRFMYDVSYSIVADRDLCIRCLTDGGYLFKYLPVTVALYNDIDGISAKETRICRAEYRAMIRKRLGIAALPFIGRYSVSDFLELLRCKEPLGKFLRSAERMLGCRFWRYNAPRQ